MTDVRPAGSGVPHDIALAFSGTAYFLRCLATTPDAGLPMPSRLSGWTRAMVAADVGYRARSLARLLEGESEYPDDSYRIAEASYGATLPAHALRHLVTHSAVQLRVAFRDRTDWAGFAAAAGGTQIRRADLPWLRARNVWLHAVDLNAGASFRELPQDVLVRLIADAMRRSALAAGVGPQALARGLGSHHDLLVSLARSATGRDEQENDEPPFLP